MKGDKRVMRPRVYITRKQAIFWKQSKFKKTNEDQWYRDIMDFLDLNSQLTDVG